MHSVSFGCLTKLGAKRAQLVQKFMPRSRVGLFRNERTRSTPLEPKLTFWCFSYYFVHLGPLGCLTNSGAKRAELVQNFVPRSGVGIFRIQCTRSTPIGPKTDVLERFLLFGCIRDRLVALRNLVPNGPN